MHAHGKPSWLDVHDGVEIVFHLLDQHDFPPSRIDGLAHSQIVELHEKDHPRPAGARR